MFPKKTLTEFNIGEKTREQKDRAHREEQNIRHASRVYTSASAAELPADDGELSGLPWGSVPVRYVIARGQAAASTASGGSGGSPGPVHQTASHHHVAGGNDGYYLSPFGGGYAGTVVPAGHGQYYPGTGGTTTADGDSSPGPYALEEESPYYYDYEYEYEGQGERM